MTALRVFQRTAEGLREITPALGLGDNLARSVVISLFSDRRLEPGDPDPPDGTADRRGWWADAFGNRPIGSRLWLLARAKLTAATLNAAREYAEESLAWLVEGGWASAVSAEASQPRAGWLAVSVSIAAPEGEQRFAFETELEAA